MQQNKRTSKITNFFNSTQKKIITESNDVVDDGQQQSQSDSQRLISTEIKKKSGHLYDIANFVVKHTLQSSEIFNCLKLTWIPDPKYDFPIHAEGKHSRKFQYKYLEIFPWLAYSEINKGAYCKWCVVFAFSGGGSGNQSLNNLVREPMTKYKNAMADLNEHSKTNYHMISSQRAKDFLKNYENGDQTAVNVLLSNQKSTAKIFFRTLKHFYSCSPHYQLLLPLQNARFLLLKE
uniref:TTF-type domain-containing protein n=1 Tax=Sipha flava TaxID=143950 RepID=A0A2S2R8Z8_9HEMI